MTEKNEQTPSGAVSGNCDVHGPFETIKFGEMAWGRCPSCEKKRLEEAQAKFQVEQDALAAKQWAETLERSGIPVRFESKTIDSFTAENDAQRNVQDFARDFAEMFESRKTMVGRCVIFGGKPGSGKTHLACGIAMKIMADYKRTALFIPVLRAIRSIKDSWRKDSDLSEADAVRRLVQPDLLILDEIGVQFGSETEKILLFDVINARYEQRKSTLFVTNLGADECKDWLGERVFDRLREDGGRFLPFGWDSYRAKAVAA